MTGRDPHEQHRTATPLELLYDLTFVVAFGAAGNEAAHFVAEGHWRTAVVGFLFAMFACSRVAGWSAHILEQKRTGRLFRPSAKYVGPGARSLESV